jgi:hypothetical protein
MVSEPIAYMQFLSKHQRLKDYCFFFVFDDFESHSFTKKRRLDEIINEVGNNEVSSSYLTHFPNYLSNLVIYNPRVCEIVITH